MQRLYRGDVWSGPEAMNATPLLRWCMNGGRNPPPRVARAIEPFACETMCVVFVAWKTREDVPLIVAANRDEFHGRPTQPAAFWIDAPHIIAGRDLEAGGTWMGVSQNGKWAAVTNLRKPEWMNFEAEKSRGDLVASYLDSEETPQEAASRIVEDRTSYGGFNLLLGNQDALVYITREEESIRSLPPGLYGLSNGSLDEPWPKVANGRKSFASWACSDLDITEGLRILRNGDLPPDDMLPSTGVELNLERMLASIFIDGDTYGTRASTLLLLRKDGHHTFVERTFGPQGKSGGLVHIPFEFSS